MSEIISFAKLEPGVYQVATPDEIETRSATVTLREDDHFWVDTKNEKRGKDEQGKDIWVEVPSALHAGTAGLLLQAEYIGARVVSRIVEMDRQRIRVIATGCCLGSDGLLEVIEKSKEYDMAAELMKAALKETKRVTSNRPDEKQSTALVKTATEETALALVAALPPYSKARIMEARLEVQTHREALCRTKSENQVLRYFIQRRGGVLKAKPGVGEVKVTLERHMLVRKLDSAQVRQATEALYGPAAQSAKADSVPDTEGPPGEDAAIIEAEVSDTAESETVAQDGDDNPWDEVQKAAVPAAAEPEAKPQLADLSPKARQVLNDSHALFTRANPAGGPPSTNSKAWREWLRARFAVTGPEVLAGYVEGDLDAMLLEIKRHLPGELYDWKPAAAEGGAA